jgi:hypothetical protein
VVASLTFVGFVCQTSKHRILIEERSDGSARCRVWKRPKSLLEAPDIELDGAARIEGTGECRARFWSFQSGKMKLEVSEPGCGPGDEPEGLVGALDLAQEDGSPQSWFRF